MLAQTSTTYELYQAGWRNSGYYRLQSISQVCSIYLSISTASPPLGDYVQVRVSAVLVEEMLLKIKSSHKIC